MVLLIQHGRLLQTVKKVFHPLSLFSFYLCCNWWHSMEEKALFWVMIPHLSLHPHAFISLPTYFMSPMSLSFSLSLHLFFSTDNRQPSHAVHLLCLWRRPSESPNYLALLPQVSFWTLFHLSSVCITFLPVLCHCLFLWIPLNPLLPWWFADLLFQARFHYFHLSFSSVYTFNLCYDLQFFLLFSSSSELLYPNHALYVFLISIFPTPLVP